MDSFLGKEWKAKPLLVCVVLLFIFLLLGCTGSDTFVIQNTKLNKLFDANIVGSQGLISFLNIDGNALKVQSGFDFNSDTNTLRADYFVGDGSGITNLPSPDFSNLVPYTGATEDVDLGTNDLFVNGRVGIGTASPIGKLTVEGSRQNPSLTATASSLASLQNDLTRLAVTISGDSPFTASLQHRHYSTDDLSYPIALNPLGGNVGIGTTSPGGPLQVNAPSGWYQSDGSKPTQILSYNGTTYGRHYIGNNWEYMIDNPKSGGKLMLYGDVKLEATGTNRNLLLGAGSGGGIYLLSNLHGYLDSRKIYFGTGDDASITYNGTNMVFDSQEVGSGNFVFSGGNVGIGTTNPTEKLEVNGNVFVDGNVEADYVHATDFITSSKVPDVKDGKKALDQLDNIDKWLLTDAKSGKKNINYGEHYASVEWIKEKIDYSKPIIENIYEEVCIPPTEILDGNGEPECEKVLVQKVTYPFTISEVHKGLSMETRVAELEKMVYELMIALCKTDPNHEFCK
jgi:hypothetical protein